MQLLRRNISEFLGQQYLPHLSSYVHINPLILLGIHPLIISPRFSFLLSTTCNILDNLAILSSQGVVMKTQCSYIASLASNSPSACLGLLSAGIISGLQNTWFDLANLKMSHSSCKFKWPLGSTFPSHVNLLTSGKLFDVFLTWFPPLGFSWAGWGNKM